MSDEEKRYAIRIAPDAEQELRRAYDNLAARAGDMVSVAWRTGFLEQIRHLSTSPNYPVAPENHRFSFTIQAFPYRRPGFSIAHRVFYRVVEETPDGPQVWILHLRPGAAGPMRDYEVREIEIRAEEMGS